MEGTFRIAHAVIPSVWIWSGKRRADGAQRETIIPFVIGDLIASLALGGEFVDESFGFTYEGLSVQGVINENEALEVLRDHLKSDILLVAEKVDEGQVAGDYKLRGWVTRRECLHNSFPSKTFGNAGIRIDLGLLKPMDELLSAIKKGNIPIEIEELKEQWWDK